MKIIQIYWPHRRAHYFALLIGSFFFTTRPIASFPTAFAAFWQCYHLLVASSVAIHLVDLVDGDIILTRSLRTLGQPSTSILSQNREKLQCTFKPFNCILEVFKIAIAKKLSTLRPHPHSFTFQYQLSRQRRVLPPNTNTDFNSTANHNNQPLSIRRPAIQSRDTFATSH
jgi:hypothetical protein